MIHRHFAILISLVVAAIVAAGLHLSDRSPALIIALTAGAFLLVWIGLQPHHTADEL